MNDIPRVKSQVQQVLTVYTLHQVFFTLLLWVPIYYQAQKIALLTDKQIFNIQSLYYFSYCLLELPTGYLADKIGHLRTMILGSVIVLAGNLLPCFWPTFEGFLTHFLMVATARSLLSGASSAYLFDFCRHYGLESRYKAIEGRARSSELVVRIVLWPLSGYFLSIHLGLPYALSAFASLVAVVCALYLYFLSRSFYQRNPNEEAIRPFAPTDITPAKRPFIFKLIIRSFATSPLLLPLMLQGTGIFLLQRMALVQLFGPFLKWKQVPVSYYGWVMSFSTIFEALGSSVGHRVRKYLEDIKAIFLATLGISLTFSLIILPGYATPILSLIAFSFLSGIAYPIQKQLMNDNILDSSQRATLLSMESLINRAISGVVAYALGSYITASNIPTLFALTGGVCALFVTFVFIFLNHRIKDKKKWTKWKT